MIVVDMYTPNGLKQISETDFNSLLDLVSRFQTYSSCINSNSLYDNRHFAEKINTIFFIASYRPRRNGIFLGKYTLMESNEVSIDYMCDYSSDSVISTDIYDISFCLCLQLLKNECLSSYFKDVKSVRFNTVPEDTTQGLLKALLDRSKRIRPIPLENYKIVEFFYQHGVILKRIPSNVPSMVIPVDIINPKMQYPNVDFYIDAEPMEIN